MTTRNQKPTLKFANEFSEQCAFEAQGRGYLSHVMVEFEGGRLFPVFFYDFVRLQQDLEENTKQGRAFIADPGMIVLNEVTLPNMLSAVEHLASEGFFEYLTPITQEDLDSSSPFRWPPQLQEKESLTT